MQEVGHFLAAFPKKVKLGIPYFIPNITLGSFGAITQVSISSHYCTKIETCKDLTTKALFIIVENHGILFDLSPTFCVNPFTLYFPSFYPLFCFLFIQFFCIYIGVFILCNTYSLIQ